jgi:hypothetical protein
MKLTNGETMGKMEQFCFPDGQGRIEIDFFVSIVVKKDVLSYDLD